METMKFEHPNIEYFAGKNKKILNFQLSSTISVENSYCYLALAAATLYYAVGSY